MRGAGNRNAGRKDFRDSNKIDDIPGTRVGCLIPNMYSQNLTQEQIDAPRRKTNDPKPERLPRGNRNRTESMPQLKVYRFDFPDRKVKEEEASQPVFGRKVEKVDYSSLSKIRVGGDALRASSVLSMPAS